MNTEKRTIRMSSVSCYLFIMILSFLMTIPDASASIITEIPEGVNDALFGGSEATLPMAKLLLTGAILASFTFAFAIIKLHFFMIFVIDFVLLVCLIALGWAESWLLLIFGLILGAFYAPIIASWLAGERGTPKE